MPEKESQFFRPEEVPKLALERKAETGEVEAEVRLGKRAETEIAKPLFEELKKEKIIENAWKTSPEVDRNKKVDFVLELSRGNFLAIDTCIAGFGAKRWENKLKEWGNNPLRELGQIHPDYEKKYERFFGPREGLSRLEIMAIQKERAQIPPGEINKLKEKVPMLCIYLDKDEVENALERFDQGEAKTAIDALYNKDTMKLKLLENVTTCLSQYLTNKEFIQKYKLEKLQPFILPKYQQAVQGVETFFQALQKNPERFGHNEIERKLTIDKTNKFLEKHRDVLK